jgi:hypothetical protein
MKHFLTVVFLTYFVIGMLYAEDFTTLDGDHYSSATIKRVEPDGLVIAYSDGVKKLKFNNLPPEVGQKYGYNPDIASQYQAQQQASAVKSYQAAIQSTQPSNIAASIPSSLIQTSAVASTTTQQALPQSPAISQTTTNLLVVQGTPITPVAPSISDSFKTFFANIYISMKNQLKTFLLKWLHILFPWAFPPPSVYLNSTTTYASYTNKTQNFNSLTNTNPLPPTPNEIVSNILSKETILATEMGMICSQFPEISNVYLQNKPLKIKGVVEKIWLSGIDHENAEITLQESYKRHVTIIYNLKKYHELNVGRDEAEESWKLVGSQLFYQCRARDSSSDFNRAVEVCAEGMSFPEKTVRLCKQNPASVYFEIQY